LYTDASDYGIGGAVFQMVDGVEHPIAFMSKTLSSQECGWSTIEKECYAIVYAFRKFEYLLRGQTFTVRTDHENLKYINDPPSPKVRRWKVALQEFDFYLEHIAGVLNVVADGFSRLLPITKECLHVVLENQKISRDQWKILGQFHNSKVGHHGVERTIARLIEAKHEWPKMRQGVQKYIKQCPCCQKMSQLKLPIHTHPFKLGQVRPMEEIHMDTLSIGVPDEQGNEHILVVIDACSRWIELYPIPDIGAETAARRLVEHFMRYGQPYIVRSDRGTQFCNDLRAALFNRAGIEHVTTTPYSHEENGLVERANKEVLRHLRAILFDENIHSEWNRALPLVQRILNAERSGVTGARPFELLFGTAIDFDRHMFGESKPSGESTISNFIDQSVALQSKIQKGVAEAIHNANAQHEAAFSTAYTEFVVGSYVICKYPDDGLGTAGKLSKLKTPWKGPMRVLKRVDDQYTVLNLASRKEETVHVSRLNPFYYDSLYVDPTEIALRDKGLYIVDKVVDHLPTKPSMKSKMTFRVRWKGYDETDDSWLPWRELIHNVALHKYLKEIGLRKWIPTDHRREEYH
jgi:hypothetical protein